MAIRFTNADRQQMKTLGISSARVFEQIDIFQALRFFRPPEKTVHPW